MNRKSSPLPAVAKKRKPAKVTLAPVPTTTYRMTLSDGHKVDRRASSAAEAIEWARREYRGYTVKECHSGMTAQEAENERNAALFDTRRSKHAVEGLVKHDIPPHRPYGENETLAEHPRKPRDTTLAMFGDDVGVGGKLAD